MKAILEFDLPEDEHNLQTAIDGYRWKSIIEEVDRLLRNKAKYEDVEVMPIDAVRKIISDTITDYGVKCDG